MLRTHNIVFAVFFVVSFVPCSQDTQPATSPDRKSKQHVIQIRQAFS